MCAFAPLIYMFMRKNDLYKKVIAVIMIYSLTVGFYCFERKFTPFLTVKLYQAKSLQKFKDEIMCQNETFIADSQCCSLVKLTKSVQKPVKVLYFPSLGTDTYYIGHVQDKNYSVDIKLLENADENKIDWKSYDYIVVPNIQHNSYISYEALDKFRNAVTDYSDGSDGRTPFYEFKDEMFANCVYGTTRKAGINWITIDKNEITASQCFFKNDLFEKHGFKFFTKLISPYNEFAKDLNIYVNTKK